MRRGPVIPIPLPGQTYTPQPRPATAPPIQSPGLLDRLLGPHGMKALQNLQGLAQFTDAADARDYTLSAQALSRALQGGQWPEAGQEAVSTGASMFSLLLPGLGGLGGMVRAFHGSPHKFDQFELSPRTSRTGEGAQMYGHGLYFAENPATGKAYLQDFSGRKTYDGATYDGAPLDEWLRNTAPEIPKDVVDAFVKNLGLGDVARAADKTAYETGRTSEGWADILKLKNQVIYAEQSGRLTLKESGAHLYEALLDTDKDKLLDWDKPLSEQTAEVQRALEEVWGGSLDTVGKAPMHKEATGGDFVQELGARLGGSMQSYSSNAAEGVSRRLRDAGIPGTKYLDQGSRNTGGWRLMSPDENTSGKWMVKSSDYNSKGLQFDTREAAENALQEKIGEQTHNFVIFDDSIIKVQKRNGDPLKALNEGAR